MNIDDMEKMVENWRPRQKEVEASSEELDFGLKLVIDPIVYQKVMHWVNKSDFEVSGLGKVIFDAPTNTLRVVEAIILPQRNTSTTTDIDGVAVSKAMYQLRNSPGDLRWWWHSHVNMGVFWSGTDINTIQQLGNGGWYSATVFNKRNEMKSAFCQKTPVRLLVPDIPTQLAVGKELLTQWDTEYEKNVENVPYSFRRGYDQDEETVKEGKKEAQETSQEEDEMGEWEEIVRDGAVYARVRSKKNLVPVRSLKERSLEEVTDVITKQMELKDLASDDELKKWEASTSDEDEESEEAQLIDYQAVDEFLKNNS